MTTHNFPVPHPGARVEHFLTTWAGQERGRSRPALPARPDMDHELAPLFRLEDEVAAELVLVRHADTTALSRQETALSETGRRQARCLAARLEALWIEAVYCAPEIVALQTAEVIAEHLERPLTVQNDLRDIDYEPAVASDRVCEGALAERFHREPRWSALPGFEGSLPFRRRTYLAIESILAHNAGRRTVVVTHSAVINAYLSTVLELPRDVFFLPEPASISVLRAQDDLYALRSLNDTSHLSGLRLCH